MKTVILCGGDSLRFQNFMLESSKVMAPIGDKPLLWHIMKLYANNGYKDFILCVKDRDADIFKYFEKDIEDWKVQVVRTGDDTNTGGRIKQIEKYITEENFMVTYGDGLSNLSIKELVNYHHKHQKAATLTAVQPKSQYGILNINDDNTILAFEEKPKMKDWINGGFFVFNRSVFELISPDLPLEIGLLYQLASTQNIMAFKHFGFWKSIDTYKEYVELNETWTKLI